MGISILIKAILVSICTFCIQTIIGIPYNDKRMLMISGLICIIEIINIIWASIITSYYENGF